MTAVRRCASALAFAALSTLARPASADEPYELRNTGAGFLALESTACVVVFASYTIAAGDPPEGCRWCEPGGFDEGARNALRMSDPRAPALASHVLTLGVLPAGAFAGLLIPAWSADRASLAAKDAWIMADVFLLTTGIADGTKKLAGRTRPAFSHGAEGATEASDSPAERNLSFFSGDAAWAFSLASSATTLAYLHGYDSAPYIAVAGGSVATLAGVLRISADMHWATDVMSGAVVGSAIGVGLPLLLHGRSEGAQLRVAPMTGSVTGATLAGVF